MSIYTDGADTVARLLAEYGMTMTYVSVTATEYIPGSGLSVTDTEHPIIGVKKNYAQNVIDGTLILQEDQELILSPSLAVVPKTGDKVIIGAEEWNVILPKKYDPAGTIIAHKLQVRK